MSRPRVKRARYADSTLTLQDGTEQSLTQRAKDLNIRPLLRGPVVKSGNLRLETEDQQTLNSLDTELANLDWSAVQQAGSERTLGRLWLPLLEKLLLCNAAFTLSCDRKDMPVPFELVPYGSRPKPDFLVSALLYHTLEGGTQLPLVSVGNKGGPSGTCIDAALPQDTCVAYAVALYWAAIGFPIQEVGVLTASAEGGVVTQFFVNYWSDEVEEHSLDEDLSAVTTPASRSGEAISGPSEDIAAEALAWFIDPFDPSDRQTLVRFWFLLQKQAVQMHGWFLHMEKQRRHFVMKVAAEPKDDDGEDEGPEERARARTLTEAEIVSELRGKIWSKNMLLSRLTSVAEPAL
ncbi:hypothetical protein HKX48_008419 [Thoreauomyces humboldtii]|nr:hypothetical protein HKX48_008419 [Thoreauomyces humboldtii]